MSLSSRFGKLMQSEECVCVVFSCCVSLSASFINSCMLCWLSEVCCFIIKVSKRILKPINRPFRIRAPRFYLPEALRWSNSPSCRFQVWQEEGRQEQRCSKSFKEQTGGTEWGGAGQDPWWQRWVWITKNPNNNQKIDILCVVVLLLFHSRGCDNRAAYNMYSRIIIDQHLSQ